MDKYKRYYGVIIFIAVVAVSIYGGYQVIMPRVEEYNSTIEKIDKQSAVLDKKKKEQSIVKSKIKKLQESNLSAQKKVYAPIESNLEDDTLFFTLYNDVIEMVHANSIKIKSINYTYNPKGDKFVDFGKDVYFVCDINMELVSNYKNLGNLVEEIYQYPYYIKINELNVKPYAKDKKVLISDLSLRLYARTEPIEEKIPVETNSPTDNKPKASLPED